MIDPEKESTKVLPLGGCAAQGDTFAYRIELWDAHRRQVESVLACAVSASLAHAIFKAARIEHPERYVTLRHGDRIIAHSN